MAKQLVVLKPLEPWFFGTDRTLKHPDRTMQRDGGYFIQSSDTPSQTTLFGALRYLGIEAPTSDFAYDKARIGSESFRIDKDNQSFGKIKSISPLYLLDDQNHFYIPVPFDHDVSGEKYSPFMEYVSVQTNHGERLLPDAYNEKNGLASGWLRVHDKTIHTDLFQSIDAIGIDKQKPDDALFKRQRKFINPKKPIRFAFFADVDFDIPERILYLGQQKSAFSASIENLSMPDVDFINHNMVYVQSDIYVQNPEALYDECKLAITKITATRPFVTNYSSTTDAKRYSTNHNLIRLIQAGSVFLPKDIEKFKEIINNNHAAIAGLNQIIIGGKSK